MESRKFDLLAVDVIILIAAFFAIAARLNAQPSSSLTPAALLSATGCGLLVTALRKLRTVERPGLFEAGISGFVLALFQFIAALTYPTVFNTLSIDAGQRLGFLTTWALIAGFSVIFAIVGATLGHLAFAPLRALPRDQHEKKSLRGHPTPRIGVAIPTNPPESITPNDADTASPARVRSFVDYLISVLLLGLIPIVMGFVFAAAFDYMLTVYQFTPGPFPTLRLLSTLLPWQIPFHIDFSGANENTIILLLWRIPLFLGNPTMFDVQALEPFVFNGAALSLLLLTMHSRPTSASEQALPLSWLAYLGLAGMLGLFLVLPIDLWMLGGLHGLLQIPSLALAIPIRTLPILDRLTFTLNLITGPVVCMGIAVLLRRWKKKALR